MGTTTPDYTGYTGIKEREDTRVSETGTTSAAAAGMGAIAHRPGILDSLVIGPVTESRPVPGTILGDIYDWNEAQKKKQEMEGLGGLGWPRIGPDAFPPFHVPYPPIIPTSTAPTPVPLESKERHAYTFLDEAVKAMKDRAAQRDTVNGGKAERSMAATVAAFNGLTGKNLTEEEGWEFMILLKMVRGRQGAFRDDDYVDGAAYFGLLGECASGSR